jgi:hypothetical protein
MLAGGSRERPLISPRPAAFSLVRTIRHLAEFTRGDVPGSRLLHNVGSCHIFSRDRARSLAAVKSGSPPGVSSFSVIFVAIPCSSQTETPPSQFETKEPKPRPLTNAQGHKEKH